jgi:hypothetical protein
MTVKVSIEAVKPSSMLLLVRCTALSALRRVDHFTHVILASGAARQPSGSCELPRSGAPQLSTSERMQHVPAGVVISIKVPGAKDASQPSPREAGPEAAAAPGLGKLHSPERAVALSAGRAKAGSDFGKLIAVLASSPLAPWERGGCGRLHVFRGCRYSAVTGLGLCEVVNACAPCAPLDQMAACMVRAVVPCAQVACAREPAAAAAPS